MGFGISLGLVLWGIFSKENREVLKGAVIALLLCILMGAIGLILNPEMLPEKKPEAVTENAAESTEATEKEADELKAEGSSEGLQGKSNADVQEKQATEQENQVDESVKTVENVQETSLESQTAVGGGSGGNGDGSGLGQYGEATGEGFIGNTNNFKIHRASCEKLPLEENQIVFSTLEEAYNAGYNDLCGVCFPNT